MDFTLREQWTLFQKIVFPANYGYYSRRLISSRMKA
jgi:hypothetical protein